MSLGISTPKSHVHVKPSLLQLATIRTRLGWFGVLHHGPTLFGLKFGFATRRNLVNQFSESLDLSGATDWVSSRIENSFDGYSDSKESWEELFVDYADGKQVSFDKLQINDAGRTDFQSKVLTACRRIPYGSTMAYGELAMKSGFPNAARAVGTAMKSNRFPIIIPCHRVVASNGIGGFSASHGTSTKHKLLAMEGYFEE